VKQHQFQSFSIKTVTAVSETVQSEFRLFKGVCPMTELKSDGGGVVRIADEALAIIASAATREVEGVSISSRTYAGDVAAKAMRKSVGIVVSVIDDVVNLSIPVTIKMETKLHEVSTEVQNRVKSAIETMTGLTVGEVNISVGAVAVSGSKR